MTWITLLTMGLIGAALAATVVGIVAATRSNWRLARKLAKASTLTALAIVAVGFALIVLVVVSPAAAARVFPVSVSVSASVPPSQKATLLAAAISNWMNCSALALPVSLVAGLVWWRSARKVREAENAPRGRSA